MPVHVVVVVAVVAIVAAIVRIAHCLRLILVPCRCFALVNVIADVLVFALALALQASLLSLYLT